MKKHQCFYVQCPSCLNIIHSCMCMKLGEGTGTKVAVLYESCATCGIYSVTPTRINDALPFEAKA